MFQIPCHSTNSCWNISLRATNVNLMVALDPLGLMKVCAKLNSDRGRDISPWTKCWTTTLTDIAIHRANTAGTATNYKTLNRKLLFFLFREKAHVCHSSCNDWRSNSHRANTEKRSWCGRCEERGEREQKGRGEKEDRRWDWETDAGAAEQHVSYHPHPLITAPPIPCLSVAPSLTFGPSHNLCPLSDHTETLGSGGEHRLSGFSTVILQIMG